MPLLFILAAMFGLAPGELTSPAAAQQRPDPVAAPSPLLLRVDLPALVPAGMDLPFRVALANRGMAPVQVELGGEPIAFDVVFRDAEGHVVWRRLDGSGHGRSVVTRTLAPGEVLSFEDHWEQRNESGQPVPPGVYTVQAVLPVPAVPGGWGSAVQEVTITP